MTYCKLKKAQSVLSYAVLIAFVGLALGTMRLYLQRAVQARVKDLSDAYVGKRQLSTLNDPETEQYAKKVAITSEIDQQELIGGAISLNSRVVQDIDLEASADSLDKSDYGSSTPGVTFTARGGGDIARDVPDIYDENNPLVRTDYSNYRYDQTSEAKEQAEVIDGLGEESDSYGDSNPDNVGSLSDRISSRITSSTGRNSGGGRMAFYNGAD